MKTTPVHLQPLRCPPVQCGLLVGSSQASKCEDSYLKNYLLQ